MKKNIRKKSIPRRSPARFLFRTLALMLCGFFIWMYLQAQIIHLRPANLFIRDLPAAFEGTKILYISDPKIISALDASSMTKIMKRLSLLEADILILGGDYSGISLMDSLNGTENTGLNPNTAQWIASIADFPAKTGKFAVAGDSDGDLSALAAAFKSAGVTCLHNESASITKNGSAIHIAGLSDRSLKLGGSNQLADRFTENDCVIVAAHNPASYIDVRVSEAKGGGTWADLVLSGHTLGGQISIAGRTLRSFTEEEKRTMAGWYYPNDLPLLVSQGAGYDFLPLRLFSESQIHLITLRKQVVKG